MISKPANWIFQPSAIANELHKNTDTISRYLTEMRTLGLIKNDNKFKWKVVWKPDSESGKSESDRKHVPDLKSGRNRTQNPEKPDQFGYY